MHLPVNASDLVSTNAPIVTVEEASAVLSKLNETRTLTELASSLNRFPGFEACDKTSLSRWVHYVKPAGIDGPARKIEQRIIKAAQLLSGRNERRDEISFTAVDCSVEAIPVHLLEYYPEWAEQFGVRITLSQKSNLNEVAGKLERCPHYFAIVPSGFSDTYKNVIRICQIAEFEVNGLFPFDFKDNVSFAINLQMLGRNNKRVASLQNAYYDQSIQSFIKRYLPDSSRDEDPAFVQIADSSEAVEELKTGSFSGIIGNAIFINNVQQYCMDAGIKLYKVGNKVFKPVKMDLVMGGSEMHYYLTAKAYLLLSKAIDCLSQDPVSREDAPWTRLVKAINDATKLNGKPSMQGQHVPAMKLFNIRDIEANGLRLAFNSIIDKYRMVSNIE